MITSKLIALAREFYELIITNGEVFNLYYTGTWFIDIECNITYCIAGIDDKYVHVMTEDMAWMRYKKHDFIEKCIPILSADELWEWLDNYIKDNRKFNFNVSIDGITLRYIIYDGQLGSIAHEVACNEIAFKHGITHALYEAAVWVLEQKGENNES